MNAPDSRLLARVVAAFGAILLVSYVAIVFASGGRPPLIVLPAAFFAVALAIFALSGRWVL